VSTLDAVSKPAGGYSPAAEGKLGKVPHEEKTSVVYVCSIITAYWQLCKPEKNKSRL
jgi:hypothetical protein